MTPRDDLSPDQRLLLEEVYRATLVSTGDFLEGPVYQNLARVLAEQGVFDLDLLLQSLSPDYLVFKPGPPSSMGIRLRAQGWYAANPRAPEIHAGLIPAIRACYDRFLQFKPTSPTRGRPVVVGPRDLWPSGALPPKARLFIVGVLLDVEGIGNVTWTEDPALPWKIGLDASIMRFSRVGDYPSFVEALSSRQLAIAS